MAEIGYLLVSCSPQRDLLTIFIIMAELLVLGFAVSQKWHLNIFAVIVLYRYREKYGIYSSPCHCISLYFMFGLLEEKELFSRKEVNNFSG